MQKSGIREVIEEKIKTTELEDDLFKKCLEIVLKYVKLSRIPKDGVGKMFICQNGAVYIDTVYTGGKVVKIEKYRRGLVVNG